MSLNKKLVQWQQAGIIDKDIAQSIADYEGSSSKPVVLWAAGGLGAFAIVIGIISVVAANWLYTPNSVKLGIDLLLCLILVFAVYKVCVRVERSRENLWLREILVIIYYGFTLASMALIGQIYQLGGSIAKLLLVWTIATIPLVLLARGKFIALLWVVGASTTYTMNVIEFYDYGTLTLGFGRQSMESIVASLLLIGPLLFIYLSRIPWLLGHRPTFAKEISRYSWLIIAIGGFFAQFLWYTKDIQGDIPTMVFLITGIATVITTLLVPKLYRECNGNIHRAMRVVLVTVFLIGFSACWHTTSLAVIGALSNLVYLCILAWAVLKVGSTPLFNFLTAVISLRILIIYFEVFGSMMQTGIGLIVGGILTLSLAWLWFKKSSRLAQHLTEEDTLPGDSHGA